MPKAYNLHISFIILLIICPTLQLWNQNRPNFIRLNASVNNQSIRFSSSVEDAYGFIWLPHENGFYKYDGYQYTEVPFKEIFGVHFTNDRIHATHRDKQGFIWVSSLAGELVRFNGGGTYQRFRNIISHRTIRQVRSFYSHEDKVFMGCDDGTIWQYDYTAGKLDSIFTIVTGDKSMSKIIISLTFANHTLYTCTDNGDLFAIDMLTGGCDKINLQYLNLLGNFRIVSVTDDMIYIFTEGKGVYKFDTRKKGSAITQLWKDDPILEKALFIYLYKDTFGNIWAASDGDGLFHIDLGNDKVTQYYHNSLNDLSLQNNTINHINEDRHNNIWVISKGGVLQILPNRKNKIFYESGTMDGSPSRILSIFNSEKSGLWIGTDGKGLHRSDKENNKYQYGLSKYTNKSYPGRFIQSITEDSDGKIWLGNYREGLWNYDPKDDVFRKIDLFNEEAGRATDVRFLFHDKKNRIWATTNVGIFLLDENGNTLISFYGHDNGLYGNISQSICEDDQGTIWIGLNEGGLFEFVENIDDISRSEFKQHLYYNTNSHERHNYNIGTMDFDDIGNLWLTTITGALIKYNPGDKSIVNYDQHPLFENIVVNAICALNSRDLWFSSNSGIIHFDTYHESIEQYDETDGLQGDIFIKRSCFLDKNDVLYFGGINGLNYFKPDQMEKKKSSASLHINSIEILNQPASSIIPKQVEKGIMGVKKLQLKYNQSSFSFRFSALDNILSSNYHYAYRLVDFNEDWIIPNQEPVATYTNIPSGNYLFEVKAGSKKGIYDIPVRSIQLMISPPWWLSKWAYLFYLGVLGLGIISLFNWLKLKNKLSREEWQNRQNMELHALKMNFFAKMSHEIQTPLTLISGPIENLSDRLNNSSDDFLKKQFNIIYNNTKRLSRIVTEMTSVKNQELGGLQLKLEERDIIKDLINIALSYEELALFQKIDFTQNYQINKYIMCYDRDMLEHVIHNLLSNAFKFTPKEGKVMLNCRINKEKEQITIAVQDSGPGIKSEELEKIFLLFYQSDFGKKVRGSGIGLALSKELVELHHGEIAVESSPENGALFSIILPTNVTEYMDSETMDSNTNGRTHSLAPSIQLTTLQKDHTEENILQHIKSLLIVEDNHQMQMFLNNVFESRFKLFFADNGEEGVNLAEKTQPDLIISDVMMPGMDGIEMSKILLNNKTTQHIPIILMSARNKEEVKFRGLKSGALEFIKKPFNTQELILKVQNIIQRSDRVIHRYRKEKISTPDFFDVKSVDELFLEELVQNIEKRIDNPDIKLQILADEMNMSYSSLYRKCQSITGKTLVDYVRYVRLKKAIILFTKNNHTISESAYMSGFNNPKYFAKCFKKEFGMTPSDFRKRCQEKGTEEMLLEHQ